MADVAATTAAGICRKKMVIAAEILAPATQHVAADRSVYQILAG